MPGHVMADPEFSVQLKRLRLARGLSLRRLGALAHYSHAYIWDLEEGRKPPSSEVAADLDKALDAGGALAGLISQTMMPPAGAPGEARLRRAEALRGAVAGAVADGAVCVGSVEEWERLTLAYGAASRFRSAGPLLDDLCVDFTELCGQLRRRHPASATRRLTRVAAEMAGLMFLTLIKLDAPAAAKAWARTAYMAADEADDPALRSWVRAQEAYVHYYSGDMRAAVTVAEEAKAVAGRGPSVGVALAAALRARAAAALGDREQTLAAIGEAENVLAGLDDDALAPSAFGYNEAQLRFHEGNALTHLGQIARAWQAQQRALELYDSGDYLDRSLVHLDRMACLARDGQPAAALDYGAAALAGVTAEQRTGMINSRLCEIAMTTPAGPAFAAAVRERFALASDDARN